MRTARWSIGWFNKPKFHIILHLVAHIERFGPAILFATEAFESFNAVIRAKSVHSNRQAPSRDIALAFAQGNRIRHLLSGGAFIPVHILKDPSSTHRPAPDIWTTSETMWRTIGVGPQKLMEESNTATSYLGLSLPNRKVKSLPGKLHYIYSSKGSNFLASGYCHQDKRPARRLSDTLTGQRLTPSHTQPFQMYKTSQYVNLFNGDKCAIGQHVVVQHQLRNSEQLEDMPPTFIAHVFEIIQKVGSECFHAQQPDGVLVQILESSIVSAKYQMPRLIPKEQWILLPLKVSSTLDLTLSCVFSSNYGNRTCCVL